MTPAAGFGFERTKASGRKSHCKICDRQRGRAYCEAHKDEQKLLRELGVPDLSPEEVTERAAQGRRVRDALAERHP